MVTKKQLTEIELTDEEKEYFLKEKNDVNNNDNRLIFAKITGKLGKSYTVMIEDIVYNEKGERYIIYPSHNMDSYCEVLPLNDEYITKICFME